MIDVDGAISLLETELEKIRARGGVDALPAPPVDFGTYWMIGYESRRYLETGDVGALLAGNAPLVVPKDGRPTFWLRTTRSPFVQMEEILAADAAAAEESGIPPSS